MLLSMLYRSCAPTLLLSDHVSSYISISTSSAPHLLFSSQPSSYLLLSSLLAPLSFQTNTPIVEALEKLEQSATLLAKELVPHQEVHCMRHLCLLMCLLLLPAAQPFCYWMLLSRSDATRFYPRRRC